MRFPSRIDRDHLFTQRDAADAILIAAGTIRAEDPPLLPGAERRRRRRERGLSPDPLRVLVSASLDLDPRARALRPREGSPALVWTRTIDEGERQARRRALEDVGAEVLCFGDEAVDLRAALAELYGRGVRRALCEGGGELNAALLAADLVDDIWLTLCPLVIGGRAAPTLADGLGARMAEARAFTLAEIRREENGELFLHYRRLKQEPFGSRGRMMQADARSASEKESGGDG